MKSFFRGMGLSLLCLGLLGVTGCSEDNESTLNKDTAKNTAEVPKHEFPTSQADYGKQLQSQDQSKKGGAYQAKGKKAAAPAAK